MNNPYGYNEQGKFHDKFHKNPQRQLIVFTPRNTFPKSSIKLEQWSNTKIDGNLWFYHQFLYDFIALILSHKEFDFLDVLLWTNEDNNQVQSTLIYKTHWHKSILHAMSCHQGAYKKSIM